MSCIIEGESVIAEKYRLLLQIGEGAFGWVYKARDLKTGINVAVKIETRWSDNYNFNCEKKIWQLTSEIFGFPHVFEFGRDETFEVNYVAMQLLGISLNEKFHTCRDFFTLRNVALLAVQLISRFESLHELGIIHRDVKLDNFVYGPADDPEKIYLLDFSVSKPYRNFDTQSHINFRENLNGLYGNYRYASLNALRFEEQSRRDDLEALGYVLVHLAIGSLPWVGIQGDSKLEVKEKIKQMKLSMSIKSLCQIEGRPLPEEFQTYIEYCRNLEFEEQPNYKSLKDLFRGLADRIGLYCAEIPPGCSSGASDTTLVEVKTDAAESVGVSDEAKTVTAGDAMLQNSSINGPTDIPASGNPTILLNDIPATTVPAMVSATTNQESSSTETSGLNVRGPILIPGTNTKLFIVNNEIAVLCTSTE